MVVVVAKEEVVVVVVEEVHAVVVFCCDDKNRGIRVDGSINSMKCTVVAVVIVPVVSATCHIWTYPAPLPLAI